MTVGACVFSFILFKIASCYRDVWGGWMGRSGSGVVRVFLTTLRVFGDFFKIAYFSFLFSALVDAAHLLSSMMLMHSRCVRAPGGDERPTWTEM